METETRGARLKRLREERDLSHAEVGRRVGRKLKRDPIGKGTVWKWEQSASPDMELEVFFALADVFEVDPRHLLTGKPSDEPDVPPNMLALIDSYSLIDIDVRAPIRALIEKLAEKATKQTPRKARNKNEKRALELET